MEDAPGYAFPHSAVDEARRLELFQQRLDPLTIRRMERLGIAQGAKCLEVGGGRGSITRWLAERVGPGGQVTATDLELDFSPRSRLRTSRCCVTTSAASRCRSSRSI